MAEAVAFRGFDVSKVTPGSEAYYWTGALPMPGTFLVEVQSDKLNRKTGKYSTHEEFTAAERWMVNASAATHQTRIWAGKCPRYKNIPVNGHEFVAYHDVVYRDGDSPDFAKVSVPGTVVRWTGEQFLHVLKQTWRNIYRDRAGREGGLKWLDSDKHPPIDPGDPKTIPYHTDIVRFDKRTDHHVSSYVYIVKLDDVGDGNYNLEPHNYYRMAPYQSMDPLFSAPPDSVEVMYPESKKYAHDSPDTKK